MKKALVLVLSILLVFSLTIPAIAAVPRATTRVDVTVQSHSLASIGTPLSMEADELVRINCTFSPRTADVDFGLITPRNTFIHVGGENGLCSQTIRINESGTYYFAVRNNSNYAVEVLGYVYY